MGIFQAVRLYFVYNWGDNYIISWQQAAVWAISDWYLWGTLSLGIARVTLAIGFDREKLAKCLSIHLISAFFFSLLQLLLYALVYDLTGDLFYHKVGASIGAFFYQYLSLVYGTIHAAFLT